MGDQVIIAIGRVSTDAELLQLFLQIAAAGFVRLEYQDTAVIEACFRG